MCGILGGSRREWNYEAGLAAISHRGPDMQKIVRGDRFTLAFARLSIIDLSEAAMQPMTSLDGKVSLVYNGEIYGYSALKKRLEKQFQFASLSDTEVILYAYMKYGDRFVDYIDGIFAIAIYDRRDQTIRLFRDRVGVKPLYYFYDGYHFAFASELKAIKSLLENQKWVLDYTAIYDYLTYAYIPAPKSMYTNIRQVKPAHKMVYRIEEHNLSQQRKYWEFAVNSEITRHKKEKILIEDLRELIHTSVKDQMIADVPVGTFLSGGVDSSIITYESILQNPNVESFSIGFQEKKYDESDYYRAFVREFHNNSNEQIFSREIYRRLYGHLSQWFDEPFADTSAFPTFLVSKLAKEKVTVVLTGDGGDELFGGYGWYDFSYQPGIFGDSANISRFYENLVGYNKKFYSVKLHEAFCETLQKYSAGHGYEIKRDKVEIAKKWGIPRDYDDYWFLREYDHKEFPLRTRLQYLDFHTYLPEILTKVDRTSMQMSLEARVPFLSRKIIEFAFSISQEERCPNGEMKHLLRKAYPEIPREILYKSKQGFCMPKQYVGRELSPNRKLLREIWRIR